MIEPIRIEPEALYDDGSLRQALGLTPTTLAPARRAGSLRYTRTGKRIFYKGAWVSAWLEEVASIAAEPRHEAAGQEAGQGRARLPTCPPCSRPGPSWPPSPCSPWPSMPI